jgi:large subunit ribosomal protein L30
LFNLFQKSDIAIVKNIPEVNEILWKIKHLVKITPIQCPNGMPDEGDYEGTYLT